MASGTISGFVAQLSDALPAEGGVRRVGRSRVAGRFLESALRRRAYVISIRRCGIRECGARSLVTHLDTDAAVAAVRTEEELSFVGRVPDAVHVPWLTWPGMRPNPDFLSDLEAEIPDKATPVLFLCRSGQRSAAAAATASGYERAFNISEGFEGALDGEQHRGTVGGWRYHGLPWVQS